AEELLLVVVAGSPGQHRAHVEGLALDLGQHVPRTHALLRALVVRASRGVDVVVAGVPAVLRGVDPARGPAPEGGGTADVQGLLVGVVLRAAAAGDGVRASGEADLVAVRAIDLGLEREVGGEALGRARVDAAQRVLDHQRGPGRTAVFVLDAQRHRV